MREGKGRVRERSDGSEGGGGPRQPGWSFPDLLGPLGFLAFEGFGFLLWRIMNFVTFLEAWTWVTFCNFHESCDILVLLTHITAKPHFGIHFQNLDGIVVDCKTGTFASYFTSPVLVFLPFLCRVHDVFTFIQ